MISRAELRHSASSQSESTISAAAQRKKRARSDLASDTSSSGSAPGSVHRQQGTRFLYLYFRESSTKLTATQLLHLKNELVLVRKEQLGQINGRDPDVDPNICLENAIPFRFVRVNYTTETGKVKNIIVRSPRRGFRTVVEMVSAHGHVNSFGQVVTIIVCTVVYTKLYWMQ